MYRLHRTSTPGWRDVISTSPITDLRAPAVSDIRRPAATGIQSRRDALQKSFHQQLHQDASAANHTTTTTTTTTSAEDKSSSSPSTTHSDDHSGDAQAQSHTPALLEASSLSLRDCVDPAALARLKNEFGLHVPDEDKGLWNPKEVSQLDAKDDPLYVHPSRTHTE